MAKNLIPEICKMLGVEIEEEFKIKGATGVDSTIFWFDLDGLHAETCEMADVTLWQLVLGNETIVKLPWKPKQGDVFWSFYRSISSDKWLVISIIWTNAVTDIARFKVGWCYRTEAEAKSALPVVATKLGVDYEI